MHRITLTPLIAILVSCFLTRIHAEATVGFEASHTGSAEIGGADDDRTVIDAFEQTYRLTAIIQGGGDNFDYRSRVSLSTTTASDAISLTVDEAVATLYPLESIRIRAGYFGYRPGFGEITSPSSFLESSGIEALLPKSLQPNRAPGLLVQTTLFAPFGFASITAAPIRGAPSIVEPTVADASVTLEFGTSIGLFDLSLIGYYGRDPEIAFTIHALLPHSDPSICDAEFLHHTGGTFATGIDVSATLGPLRLWVDAATWTSMLFATTDIPATTLETQLVEAAALEVVGGASLEIPRFGTLLGLEYRGATALFAPQAMINPFLASALIGTITVYPFTSKLRITETVALSLTDGSAAFLTGITFSPDDQITFTLDVPLFSGDANSELGQFGGPVLVAWSAKFLF